MAVNAYVLITVAVGKNKDVLSAIQGVAGVKQAHACWGVHDFIAFVEAADLKALSDLVLTNIHAIDGVERTDTRIVAEL